MRFPTPLVPGRLIRRYKRFLADIVLEDGREVVAHCPNPGAMIGLAQPGMKVWLEPNDDPKKKLRFGWRLVQMEDAWIGIDTGVPNKVVGEALRAGAIPELAGDHSVRAEVKYGAGSRIDFLLEGAGAPTYVEVKNVHLCRQPGLAEFPDCVTKRGAKHLQELADMAQSGARAVMLYVVQRTDCTRMELAADLDPAYAAAYGAARAAGVEAYCYDTRIDRDQITLGAPLAAPLVAPGALNN
jgi:sugar fermentation stimulation protein A